MAKRQKLAVTAEEPKLKKRIKLKTKQEQLQLFESIDTTLYYSGFALTDNKSLVIFFVDDNLLTDFQTNKEIMEFELTENDLDINFDKSTLLEPNENWHFENFGYVRSEIFKWFRTTYPKCVFHPIVRWFGKQVNTLLIVLEQRHGKPVGVVKTFI
jgi:hypothetical protein